MKLIVSLLVLVATSLGLLAQEPMPVFHKNDVILFIGDSITEGGRQGGNDFNHTMGQDYAYIISAEIGAQFPERNLNFLNRGISGNKITDLAGRWQRDVIDLKPNLLSILVGINDTLGNLSVEQFAETYDQQLALTLAALPNLKIILAEPFLLPVGRYKETYDRQLVEVQKRQEVVAKMADKYHLPLIDYQKVFDAACQNAPADHWSWDGVHPTYAGHGLMVKAWIEAVNQAWPQG